MNKEEEYGGLGSRFGSRTEGGERDSCRKLTVTSTHHHQTPLKSRRLSSHLNHGQTLLPYSNPVFFWFPPFCPFSPSSIFQISFSQVDPISPICKQDHTSINAFVTLANFVPTHGSRFTYSLFFFIWLAILSCS
ncbi:hypothetical protein L2E82_36172 [Cichorium intybus]|uniref:Uncharacterized protein n=1 Tax=Cichorium intybus TaxID=13427 RepID=A0ACB9BQY7_CICIN|nr:hypothetical protein L2E82_36172 [Cichorium intybus]